jgi:hypothetical protein
VSREWVSKFQAKKNGGGGGWKRLACWPLPPPPAAPPLFLILRPRPSSLFHPPPYHLIHTLSLSSIQNITMYAASPPLTHTLRFVLYHTCRRLDRVWRETGRGPSTLPPHPTPTHPLHAPSRPAAPPVLVFLGFNTHTPAPPPHPPPFAQKRKKTTPPPIPLPPLFSLSSRFAPPPRPYTGRRHPHSPSPFCVPPCVSMTSPPPALFPPLGCVFLSFHSYPHADNARVGDVVLPPTHPPPLDRQRGGVEREEGYSTGQERERERERERVGGRFVAGAGFPPAPQTRFPPPHPRGSGAVRPPPFFHPSARVLPPHPPPLV